MKRIFTVYLLMSLTLGLYAQQGQWETIVGISTEISRIASQGNMVLAGTSGAGLLQWNGPDDLTHINTSNSDIPGDAIGAIAIAPNGHWWVKTEAGIGQFDGNNWSNWSLTSIGLPANTPVNNIRVAPDTSVYVLTNDGFARYHNAVWTVQNMANSGLPNNQLTDVVFTPGGKAYFGSRGSGILLLDNGNWTVYNSAATGITNMNFILGLAFGAEGALWAIGGPNSTASIRLVRFTGNIWTGFSSAGIGITGVNLSFRVIAGNPTQGIWLTHSMGLSHLEAGIWTHYTRENIGCLPLTNTSIALDGTGQIWFTSFCGLLRFDGQAWNYLDTGLPGYCWGPKFEAVAEGSDGSLWLGANESQCITRTDGVFWEHYNPLALGASTFNINAIFTDRQGRTWFGLDISELLIYDDGQWTFTDTCATIFPSHWVRTFADSPGGDIWMAFVPLPGSSPPFAGVARYAGGQWTFWTSTEVPNLYNNIYTLESNEDGILWVGVLGKGLLRFDGTTWTLFNTSNSGLPSNDIFDIATAPDGVLWLATGAGLVSYDGQNWSVTNTANSGLPSDRLRRLAFDQAGGLYVGYIPSITGQITAVRRDGQWIEISPPSAPNFTGTDPIVTMIVDSSNRMIFNTVYSDFYIYDPMLVSTDEPVATQPSLTVAPNPTFGPLTLQLDAPLRGEARLCVWNMFGQIVFQRIIPRTEDTIVPLDLSALPAGVYGVSLWQDGSVGATIKVVKR